MIGAVERVKNNVLLKCSTLNDEVISKDLVEIINYGIYHFAEGLMSLISDLNFSYTEEDIRNKTADIIKIPIIKKIKRKLFIDSLALQITNDSFTEDYASNKITLKEIEKKYIKELNINKSSNQLNMTEDLNLNEIIEKLRLEVDNKITNNVRENVFLTNAINDLFDKIKDELELKLKEMVENLDSKYLLILLSEIKENIVKEEKERELAMDLNDMNVSSDENKTNVNKFDKYDDMTLFNKVILSLNTKEEKLTRKEGRLEKRRKEIDEYLTKTNKNIEKNIERENKLSQRKLELNASEVELNSKLSEAEVIFLNIKPLIKGLNKIKVEEQKGGVENE